jgi:hypothetical protein
MTLPQLAARIHRLHALAMGLRKEHHRSGGNFDSLTLDERLQYAAAICATAEALDAACIPLSSALRRVEGQADSDRSLPSA